ncbi:hypothetical protein vseg_010822 [Gypsophila vaccaria]
MASRAVRTTNNARRTTSKRVKHCPDVSSPNTKSFQQKGKNTKHKVGDLVLKSVRASLRVDPRGKFKPNWSGPYIINEIYSGGAVKIIDLDGQEFNLPTNLDQLKRYYP